MLIINNSIADSAVTEQNPLGLKRHQYNINTMVELKDGRQALTTGWGDNATGLVELRLTEDGNIKMRRLSSLKVEGDINNV